MNQSTLLFQSSADLKFHLLKDLSANRPEDLGKPDPVILMRAKGNPGVFVEVGARQGGIWSQLEKTSS
jgi:hypothetical protein